jgi:SAM-dependent methyltransferase
MCAFYQEARWLYLKSKILDQPSYSKAIFNELVKHKFKRVLDCGTGAGDFVKTLEKWFDFDTLVGFDINPDLVEKAKQKFADSKKNIEFHVHNLYNREAGRKWKNFDLVTGQALLEHTDMDIAVPILKGFSKPDGLLYFPHNYMSPTMFEPVFDTTIDLAVVHNFDRFSIENQMFEGRVCGDCQCGAKLFNIFKDFGFEVLHFEMSSWVLYPKGTKGYAPDEREILEMMVDFFYEANKSPTIPLSKRIHPIILEEWKKIRLQQIDDNQLVYICPQTSILVRNQG